MAEQEGCEDDVEIRSLVSQLREAHRKVEENSEKMQKLFGETYRNDVDVETVKASIEKLIKDRQGLRKSLEDNAAFLYSIKDNSSRVAFLNESVRKLKNIDLGNQEIQISGGQERGEASNSSGYVADAETEQKDPIFSLNDSDTTSEEDKEVWNQKTVDPDIKRRFLDKAKESSSDGGSDAEVEYPADDGLVLSNIEGLVEDLKKQDEGENK